MNPLRRNLGAARRLGNARPTPPTPRSPPRPLALMSPLAQGPTPRGSICSGPSLALPPRPGGSCLRPSLLLPRWPVLCPGAIVPTFLCLPTLSLPRLGHPLRACTLAIELGPSLAPSLGPSLARLWPRLWPPLSPVFDPLPPRSRAPDLAPRRNLRGRIVPSKSFIHEILRLKYLGIGRTLRTRRDTWRPACALRVLGAGPPGSTSPSP